MLICPLCRAATHINTQSNVASYKCPNCLRMYRCMTDRVRALSPLGAAAPTAAQP